MHMDFEYATAKANLLKLLDVLSCPEIDWDNLGNDDFSRYDEVVSPIRENLRSPNPPPEFVDEVKLWAREHRDPDLLKFNPDGSPDYSFIEHEPQAFPGLRQWIRRDMDSWDPRSSDGSKMPDVCFVVRWHERERIAEQKQTIIDIFGHERQALRRRNGNENVSSDPAPSQTGPARDNGLILPEVYKPADKQAYVRLGDEVLGPLNTEKPDGKRLVKLIGELNKTGGGPVALKELFGDSARFDRLQDAMPATLRALINTKKGIGVTCDIDRIEARLRNFKRNSK